MSMEKKKESNEVKTDVKLLLECLQYQADNAAATKQALFTLASIFSNHEGAKDHFRSIGGLNFVFSIITSTTNSEVQESAFYCLGCCIENNVFCQKCLTSTSVFAYLHGILSDTHGPTRLKQTANFFLLNLVSNNGQGQTLVRTTGCLSDLLQLLRSAFPKTEMFNRQGTTESWFEDVGLTSVELWSSVASTLCMCVNNPRNDENQGRCGLELGFMFSLIQNCDNPCVLRPLLSLVGFTVASNAHTQNQVRQCGGLAVLIARLKVALDLALRQNSESDSRQTQINLAVTIAGTIDSCILDNVENAEDLRKGDAILSVLQLLRLESLRQEDKLQVVLTLGHMLELSCESRGQIDAVTGLPDLVKLLTESEDEELSKALKYLLQMCVAKNDKSSVDSEAERMDAVRRENGKKMLLKIDEISERLKAIEKETEEKSLILQQTGQGKDALPVTSCEKNLLFQLQQEREERMKMESLAFQMHALSPHVQHYGRVPIHSVQGSPFVKADRLHRHSTCCGTPNSMCLQKLNVEHPSICCMNNYPEYSWGNQGVDCPSVGGQGPARLVMPNYITTQQNSRRGFSPQVYENVNCHDDLRNIPADVEAFSQEQNPANQYILDHKGDRNSDYQCLESHGEEPVRNIDNTDNHRNGGKGTLNEINQMAGANMDNSKFENTGRTTMANNLSGSKLSCPGKEPMASLRINRKEKEQEKQPVNHMLSTSSSATDISKTSNSHDQFLTRTRYAETSDENLVDNQKSRTSVFTDAFTDNTCNDKNRIFSTSIQSEKHTNYEVTSPLTKTCTVSESEKNDVFVKPRPPPRTSCYQTPVRRPGNTRMTPSQTIRDGLYSSVKCGASLHPKLTAVESYPDTDCSSVIDTRSEFDFDLVETAKKEKLNQNIPKKSFSQNICYNVTPIRWKAEFIKGMQRVSGRMGTPIQSNIRSTPCSVKSVKKMTDHSDGKSVHECCSDTFSSVADDESDEESSESSLEENLVCLDNQKSTSKLKVSKCPGCTVWLSSPSDNKRMLMNSRTYNLLLETSLYTCENHKAIRNYERKYIQKMRKNLSLYSKTRPLPSISMSSTHNEDLQCTKKTISVYDFITSESDDDGRVTPPHSTISCQNNLASLRGTMSRRSRIPYTEEEVDSIMKGVTQLGTRWNQILVTFKFHASRTATDLRDKYKRIIASQSDVPKEAKAPAIEKNPRKRGSRLFSMCEERRLVRGVKMYGYNWKSILNSFSFSKGRTSQDLRNRWRNMHKKVTHK